MSIESILGKQSMKDVARRFAADQSGATAVEYALLAGIIALGIIASVGGLRDGLNTIFNNTKTELSK
jgi:pilus assembly protein Flp/PilA